MQTIQVSKHHFSRPSYKNQSCLIPVQVCEVLAHVTISCIPLLFCFLLLISTGSSYFSEIMQPAASPQAATYSSTTFVIVDKFFLSHFFFVQFSFLVAVPPFFFFFFYYIDASTGGQTTQFNDHSWIQLTNSHKLTLSRTHPELFTSVT